MINENGSRVSLVRKHAKDVIRKWKSHLHLSFSVHTGSTHTVLKPFSPVPALQQRTPFNLHHPPLKHTAVTNSKRIDFCLCLISTASINNISEQKSCMQLKQHSCVYAVLTYSTFKSAWINVNSILPWAYQLKELNRIAKAMEIVAAATY